MNIKEIQDLILTMDKTSIENVDIENSEFKISISKNNKVEIMSALTHSQVQTSQPLQVETQTPVQVETNSTLPQEKKAQEMEEIKECNDMFVVKSPIVGTFYDAASPDSDSFVKVGDKVKVGQTLCIIEAMKIMNQIESEVAGEIYEILVKNEDVVEYNQPLMIVRR